MGRSLGAVGVANLAMLGRLCIMECCLRSEPLVSKLKGLLPDALRGQPLSRCELLLFTKQMAPDMAG
jgi:hypothetical protein